MKKIFSLIILCLYFFKTQAQKGDFPFGKVTKDELRMTVYQNDSSADAVILDEFGYSWINTNQDSQFKVYFQHHYKLKILSTDGFEHTTVRIPLFQHYDESAVIERLSASIFNLTDGTIQEKKLDWKQVIYEKQSKNYRIAKFTFPDVKVGSVIEVDFLTESPWQFIHYFPSWHFQSDIPKVRSEFWAKIPATFDYNISLQGFYPLSYNNAELQRACLTARGGTADCTLNKYAMENIPAFIEEDFMTSPKNFLSSIDFELKEYRGFYGEHYKYTKEWKDADKLLKESDDFGVQFKKAGGNFWEEKIAPSLTSTQDTLAKAKKVFGLIRGHYSWNGENSMETGEGIKRAYEKKIGNSAEINISLITALEFAGVKAYPVILSTRENGLLSDLFPVLKQFNYVVGYCKINNKEYFLDGTDKLLPFGMLPMKCLNGKGRILKNFKSDWINIPNKDKNKSVSYMEIQLTEDGSCKGKVVNSYLGYSAFLRRKEISGFNSDSEFVKDLDNKNKFNVLKYSYDHLQKLDTVLTETFEIEIAGNEEPDAENLLLNPFLFERVEKNPFVSQERLYPVDYGMPYEHQIIFSLQIPEKYQVLSVPDKVAAALPGNGGKFIFNIQNLGNKITLTNIFSINKPVYSSEEYPYLKELYNKIVQAQRLDIILAKKK